MEARKEAEEKRLRAAAAADPKLKDAVGSWDKIEKAHKVRAEIIRRYTLLEGGSGMLSELFGIARTLVRAADEKSKPQAERLREFIDSNKEPLELELFSEEPIYEGFEIVKLADSFTYLAGELGQIGRASCRERV